MKFWRYWHGDVGGFLRDLSAAVLVDGPKDFALRWAFAALVVRLQRQETPHVTLPDTFRALADSLTYAIDDELFEDLELEVPIILSDHAEKAKTWDPHLPGDAIYALISALRYPLTAFAVGAYTAFVTRCMANDAEGDTSRLGRTPYQLYRYAAEARLAEPKLCEDVPCQWISLGNYSVCFRCFSHHETGADAREPCAKPCRRIASEADGSVVCLDCGATRLQEVTGDEMGTLFAMLREQLSAPEEAPATGGIVLTRDIKVHASDAVYTVTESGAVIKWRFEQKEPGGERAFVAVGTEPEVWRSPERMREDKLFRTFDDAAEFAGKIRDAVAANPGDSH